MVTIAHTGIGSHFFVNGLRLAQIQSAMLDHGMGRLRIRLIHWTGDPGQEVLRKLRVGCFVEMRVEMPDETIHEFRAVLRFCRTRLSLNNANRTTIEFTVDREQFSAGGKHP